MNRNALKAVVLLLVSFCSIQTFAQSVAINDDASLPHASAILDIKVAAAAKKGVLLPRMTSAQRAAIVSPGKGLLVYDSTVNSFWFHNGTAWTEISKGPNAWTVNGSDVFNAAANIGIGITTPKAKLNVVGDVLFGLSLSGIGGKVFWNANKRAFRAGDMEDIEVGNGPGAWDDGNVGETSFATGANTIASGQYSVAVGLDNRSTGISSFVGGVWSSSTAYTSFAYGYLTDATGEGSVGIGNYLAASGLQSAAFNYGNSAIGESSFAANNSNESHALSSATFGAVNVNNTNNGFVVGEVNDPIVTLASAGAATAPLFTVGNGNELVRKNAFVVLRNGVTGLNKNPGSAARNDGLLQLKQPGTKHLLTFEAATTTNKWSFSMTPNLTIYYNNALRGTFNATSGAYTSVSDIRLKKDIHSLQPVLEDIMQLKTYTYHLLDNADDAPLSYGLMAQELQEIFPDMVAQIDPANKGSLLGVNYSNLAVVSIKGLQEMKLIIDNQTKSLEQAQAENRTLRDRLDAQEERLKKLEAQLIK